MLTSDAVGAYQGNSGGSDVDGSVGPAAVLVRTLHSSYTHTKLRSMNVSCAVPPAGFEADPLWAKPIEVAPQLDAATHGHARHVASPSPPPGFAPARYSSPYTAAVAAPVPAPAPASYAPPGFAPTPAAGTAAAAAALAHVDVEQMLRVAGAAHAREHQHTPSPYPPERHAASTSPAPAPAPAAAANSVRYTAFLLDDNSKSALLQWQGLTLAHFRAQLEDLRDTSLASGLNFSTFGPYPRVNLGNMGDAVS